MSESKITCAMCGERYSPSEHPACGSCPLNDGCQLTCCPVCGFENVDVNRSVLARLAARFLPAKSLREARADQPVRGRSTKP